jgi:glycosyltransferase involved in cell wall biosynthesis
MKILIVIPAIGSVYGGPSKSVIELAQALASQGVAVDLVTTTANGDRTLDVPTFTWIENNGIRIQYFPYWSWQDYKWSFSLSQWLHRHVKDYDMVHTNAIFSLPNLPAYWACQYQKVPYLVTPRGMLEPWALSHKGKKKQIYFNLLEEPALQKAAALQVLATSEAERISPLNLAPPLALIPNGIHHQDFDPLTSAEAFYQKFPHLRQHQLILFLGRIDPKKGLDLLAPAFAQVHQQFPHTHLVIAGPDNINFQPTAEQYFIEAGCRESVTFTGMLTGAMKYSALAAASIYVAPSYSEGFSMSVLEGMASGLPCIITTGCNFPEAGTANAAYIIDINATALTEALQWCLQNPDQAQSTGEQARQFILENYTWDKIAQQLVTVYQWILGQGPKPNCVSLD